MKEKTTLQLAFRLNELIRAYNDLGLEKLKTEHDIAKLDEEWDSICYELWDRIPSLTDDPNLKPKRKVRKK